MDLKRLRYFVTVAQLRSFSKAASMMNMTQPPLSQRIREIETEVGAVLIDRQARPLLLTEAGRLFYDQAVHVLRVSDQMQATMKEFVAAERPRLVLGLLPSAVYTTMPDIIRRFTAIAPDVDFSLRELTSIEQVSALRDGLIDAGLSGICGEHTDITNIMLREERVIIAVSNDHRFAKRRQSVDLAELQVERLILYPSSPRPSFADHVLQSCENHGILFDDMIEVRELQTALILVAAGQGVCLIPETVGLLTYPGIVTRDIEQDISWSHVLCYRANDGSSGLKALLDVFADLILEWRCYGHSQSPDKRLSDSDLES